MTLNAGWRRSLANLALLAFATSVSVALVVGAGELYFRLRLGKIGSEKSWLLFHPDRGWALQPGEYVHIDHNDLATTRVLINDLGLRGPPLTMAVPAGKRRVSILGDSFVFGAALEQRETIPSRLQSLMGDGYEAVNLGVEGYGTGAETLLLEDLVSRGYVPGDAVVLVFFPNDVSDNAGLEYGTQSPVKHRPRFWVDSTGALMHTRPASRAHGWGRALERNWLFLRYLRSRATNLMLSSPWMLDVAAMLGFRPELPRTPAVIEGFYGPGFEERWRNTEQILAYFAGSTRRMGSRLHVAFVPSPFQVVETLRKMAVRRAPADSVFAAFIADEDRPQRYLREFCDRAGLPFIDATPALRQKARTRSPFLVEAHLNAFGAEIVAAAIRDGMMRSARP